MPKRTRIGEGTALAVPQRLLLKAALAAEESPATIAASGKNQHGFKETGGQGFIVCGKTLESVVGREGTGLSRTETDA